MCIFQKNSLKFSHKEVLALQKNFFVKEKRETTWKMCRKDLPCLSSRSISYPDNNPYTNCCLATSGHTENVAQYFLVWPSKTFSIGLKFLCAKLLMFHQTCSHKFTLLWVQCIDFKEEPPRLGKTRKILNFGALVSLGTKFVTIWYIHWA